MASGNNEDLPEVQVIIDRDAAIAEQLRQKDEEIRQLREENDQLRAGQPQQVDPQCFTANERRQLESDWQQFRESIDKVERCISNQKAKVDGALNEEQKQQATSGLDAITGAWLAAAGELHNHINEVTNRMNVCVTEDNDDVITIDDYDYNEPMGSCPVVLCRDVCLPNMDPRAIPMMNPMEFLPKLMPHTIQLCDKFVGTMNLVVPPDHPESSPTEPPLKIVISKHESGFYEEVLTWSDASTVTSCFRPDGHRYESSIGITECSPAGDGIAVGKFSVDSQAVREMRYAETDGGCVHVTVTNSALKLTDVYLYVIDRNLYVM